MKSSPYQTGRPCRIGFIQVPGYSAISSFCAIEPLRMANQLTERQLYEWQLLTADGQPAEASNGLSTSPARVFDCDDEFDMVFVCAGVRVKQACDRRLINWLQHLARRHVPLGGLCTGPYILARAGVLDGYRCTVHWEHISSINEETEFPNTLFSSKLFVIDRDRYTCSGGVAPLDLMLNIIKEQCGSELAASVSEEFIHDRIRGVGDSQRVPLRARVGPGQPKLLEAVALMEANIEEPLTLSELAHYVNISRRQLERLFRAHLDRSPTRYYLELRLKRAREFLLQTSMSILDVALACGFSSSPHFSKCYHDYYDMPPSQERRRQATQIRLTALAPTTVPTTQRTPGHDPKL
ncbi:GlxA family transcriptional regulator [Salinisphaera hydrothermalis]|uniref:GlxA family transcriptional regulator n=1 Tax=Salinisphaera hydrothermalis TaxID=563188 RepID=UPI0033408BBF